LSQELHTAKLLSPHVLVGYWGQNPRWDVVGSTPTAIHTASCRTPLSEPCVHLSAHTALPFLVASWVSFLHYAYLPKSLRYSLPPFVLSQALPWAFGYYGGSVTMSLSACRRSRIDARWTFSVFRPPVRVLASVISEYTTVESFHMNGFLMCHHGVTSSSMLRWAACCALGYWGSANPGLASVPCGTSCTQDSQHVTVHTFLFSCFPTMLFSPRSFLVRLSRCLRWYLLPTICPSGAILASAEAAHTRTRFSWKGTTSLFFLNTKKR